MREKFVLFYMNLINQTITKFNPDFTVYKKSPCTKTAIFRDENICLDFTRLKLQCGNKNWITQIRISFQLEYYLAKCTQKWNAVLKACMVTCWFSVHVFRWHSAFLGNQSALPGFQRFLVLHFSWIVSQNSLLGINKWCVRLSKWSKVNAVAVVSSTNL